jgi:predicted aspartyl protease
MALIEKSPGRKDLKSHGPRMRIFARPASPQNSKLVDVAALIDTGASRTVITPQKAKQIGLQQTGYGRISHAGGIEQVPAYAAVIEFPDQKFTSTGTIELLGCTLQGQPIECLLGRDVLSRWVFLYDGRSGMWRAEEEDSQIPIIPPEI